MENLPQKKKPGLPARLTIMQRKFAELLVFNEGHKFAYECAKEAGYEGDNASLRVIASRLQNPKYFPLVFKHIGELREETYKKYAISFNFPVLAGAQISVFSHHLLSSSFIFTI